MIIDSRNTFIAASYGMDRVIWSKHKDQNEWIYFGPNLSSPELQVYLDSVFSGNNLILIDGRHDTSEFSRDDILKEIQSRIDQNVMTICDADLRVYMQFSHIGVVRHGIKQA